MSDLPPQPDCFLAPDIGVRIHYRGAPYMVSGWLKEMPPPAKSAHWLDDILYEAQQKLGPRQQRLMWCDRTEATHVSGKGVCGCVAPVDMVTVIGRVPIPGDRYTDMLRSQALRVGEPIF